MSPDFKFLVEYSSSIGTMTARFTNEKHARRFAQAQKKAEIPNVKLFSLTKDGKKNKEIKIK